MSVEMLADVMKRSRSKGADRLLLLAMANEAHSSGELTAYRRSLRWLAHMANISERQASASVKSLTELGEIEVISDGMGAGRKSTDYRLTIPTEDREMPPARDRMNRKGVPKTNPEGESEDKPEEPATEDAASGDEESSSQGGRDFIPGMNPDHPRAEECSAPSSRSLPFSSRSSPVGDPTDRERAETTDPEPVPSVPLEKRARETVGTDSESATLFGSESASTADAAATSSAAAEAKPKGRARPAGEHDPDFVRFWKMAPTYAEHHGDRQEAYKAWVATRRSGATAGLLLTAWEQATTMWASWPEDQHGYIPAERNWLGRNQWQKPVKSRSSNVRGVPSASDRNRSGAESGAATYARLRAEQGYDQPQGRPGALPVREVVESHHTPHRRPA